MRDLMQNRMRSGGDWGAQPDGPLFSPAFRAFLLIDLILLIVVICVVVLRPADSTEAEQGGSSMVEASSEVQTSSDGQGTTGINPQRLAGLVEDGSAVGANTRETIASSNAGFTDNITALYQEDVLPSGCEIASLTAALNSMGFRVKMTDIVDDYLMVDGDYQWGYIASPYEDNGGGFPPAIVDAANSYLIDQNSRYRAHDLTGSSFESLTALTAIGYPVLVWTTLRLTPPVYESEVGESWRVDEDGDLVWDEEGDFGTSTGQVGDWYINEHCVVIYGSKNGLVSVCDPLEGLTVEDAELFADIYEQCGSMALYIR